MSDPTRRFRTLMGRFVTGITVVAVATPDGVAAMTANAVTAVSLDPLMLLVCVRRESRLLPLIEAAGHFSVNVLAAGQDDVSRHYGGGAGTVSPARWASGAAGAPMLEGANAAFVCRLAFTQTAGDHEVVYGEVVDMVAADPPAPALVYAAGRYADVALTA